MYNIVFMGTNKFAYIILKSIIESNLYNKLYKISFVVTQPCKGTEKKKELSNISEICLHENITLFKPININKSVDIFEKRSIDLIITASYGQILSCKILQIPTVSAINIHASLLPKYRGAAPIQHCLINGDKETGSTIIYMCSKMDAGDIIDSQSMRIEKEDNYGTVNEKLSIISSKLLIKNLPKILSKNANTIKQDPALVSYAPKIFKKDTLINWSEPANIIVNKIRAFSPNPGAYTYFSGNLIKIFEAHIVSLVNKRLGGEIIEADKKQCVVSTGTCNISIKTLQLAGKKVTNIKDFMNGIGRSIFRKGLYFNNE